MKISILIPFRNAEPYLEACLDSVLKQDESDWEVLAVDDHSDDRSAEIVKRYALQDSRIQVIKNSGRGIIEALRAGYAASNGDFITRMDADDIMEPIKLGELKRILQSEKAPVVATGLVKYFSDGFLGHGYQRYEKWVNRQITSANPYKEVFKECVVPSPCWMVRRADLDAVGAFEPDTYPEDYDLCFRFYAAGYRIVSSSHVLHRWRDYPTRTSRTDPRLQDQGFLKLKVDWFTKLELKLGEGLVLWGAGNKGKALAKILQEKGVGFRWVCNTPSKIGQLVYGVRMESPDVLQTASGKTIVAISQKGGNLEVEQCFQSWGKVQGQDYFFFL